MADDMIQEVKVVYSSSSGLSNVITDLKKVEDHASRIQKSLDDAFKGGALSGSVYNSATKSLTKEIQRQTDSVVKNADATQQMRKATTDTAASLPRLRYALYDVSTTATIAGASLLGVATAITGLAIKMDREFVDVIRTTGVYMDDSSVSAEQLRKSFNDLFTSMPTSWGALTEIGTLAGQLGVASENVDDFTRLVAMFASTTDVSVEQSATAFGRLSELLDVNASEYENLGSSILAVGVASVATESQIINTTTQLASMGNFAGFSADEVVGLSSALASLGTQPELSRGTITRLFTNISKAIAEGGDRLNEFARVSNMSASDFGRKWGEDAAGTFQRLIEGLGRVEEQGGNSVVTLNRLGITAARDIPTILRLAQNHRLLAEQMEIARTGYADGTALGEQYGLQAETVAAKLEVLRNNLTAFTASLGEGNRVFAPFIDILTTAIQGVTKFVETVPGGKEFISLQLGLVAIAGSLALLVGLFARGAASSYAFKTALAEMAVAQGLATRSTDALAMSTWRLAASIKGVRLALISTGVGAALVALGTAAAWAFGKFTEASEPVQKFSGDLQGLRKALESDTANVVAGTADAISSFVVVTDEAGQVIGGLGSNASSTSKYIKGLEDKIDGVNDKLQQQTVYVGELTKEWLYNQIISGQVGEGLLDNMSTVQAVLEDAGTNLGDALQAALTPDPSDDLNLDEYIKNLNALLRDQELLLAGVSVNGVDPSLFSLEELEAEETRLRKLISAAEIARDALSGIFTGVESAYAQSVAVDALANAMGVMGDNAEYAEGQLSNLADSTFDTERAQIDLIDAVSGIGKSMAENGSLFDQYSEGGRANINALLNAFTTANKLAGDDTALFASLVQNIIQQVVAAGGEGVLQLAAVRNALSQLVGSARGDAFAQQLLSGALGSGMSQGFQRAGRSAGGASKKVRTLLDYVKDLSGVMRDAFDFRFGFEQSTDGTLETFRGIEEAFARAREEIDDLTRSIQDYQAKISGLESDKSILEYFLTIAEEYDDELRVQAIRAELEAVNADLADSQADLTKTQTKLTKAQQKATPTLTGTTEAAVEQRKAVLDLVSSYQDQIEAYAATGASQAEIATYTMQVKAAFEDQMRTLGYSQTEIKKYSVAFDDFRKIVERVPRNLTINVNASTDPATKALAEFEAKFNQTRSSIGGSAIQIKADTSSLNNAATRMELTAQIAGLVGRISIPGTSPAVIVALTGQLAGLRARLNALPPYWDGGFVGRGGKKEPMGVVHGGEYVIPKQYVNQQTGLPYEDAYARLSKGMGSPVGSYANGGYVGGMTGQVDLSYASIMAIARAVQPHLILDGQAVARSVNRQSTMNNLVGAS